MICKLVNTVSIERFTLYYAFNAFYIISQTFDSMGEKEIREFISAMIYFFFSFSSLWYNIHLNIEVY
jgi:hypothetical protein